jgi:hypothetical protein
MFDNYVDNYHKINNSQSFISSSMAYAQKETIGDELIKEINLLIAEAKYIDEDSLHTKRLLHSAAQLMNADPSEANFIKAGIYQLCGNIERTENHIRIANNLPNQNSDLLRMNSAAALANLGLYTKAQGFFCEVKEMFSNNLNNIVETGLGSLNILKLNELFIKANKMNLEFNHQTYQVISRAAEILSNSSISDKDLAQYADVFGSVLHDKRLMVKGDPIILIGDNSNDWHPETVFIIFRVQTDFQNAAQMYKEGTKRLISKFSDIPESLHFSIEAY